MRCCLSALTAYRCGGSECHSGDSPAVEMPTAGVSACEQRLKLAARIVETGNSKGPEEMNDYDDLQYYRDRWLQDYGENTRPLPLRPFSASTLALNAGLEWPSPALA